MQDNIISLLDENGVESQFEVILTFTISPLFK